MKMEAICSFETSVDIQRTARRYIPEDSTLHNDRCENLKFYELQIFYSWSYTYLYSHRVWKAQYNLIRYTGGVTMTAGQWQLECSSSETYNCGAESHAPSALASTIKYPLSSIRFPFQSLRHIMLSIELTAYPYWWLDLRNMKWQGGESKVHTYTIHMQVFVCNVVLKVTWKTLTVDSIIKINTLYINEKNITSKQNSATRYRLVTIHSLVSS
jgi:hypothetical protein